MKTPRFSILPKWVAISGLAITLILGIALQEFWMPHVTLWVQSTISGKRAETTTKHDDHGDHGGGDHGHEHDDADRLELSPQARRNIGLTPEYLSPVQLQTFRRTITVPAIVVARPGRTQIEVSTPMAGVITHVHAVQGEAVKAGTLLFEIRITADELVSTQTELLKTIGNLDVEQREIARLKVVTQSGAVAQKTLLEHEYAKDKLEVLLNAQREALRLQGLSERQIDAIVKTRRLLRDLQIVAPSPDEHSHDEIRLSQKPIVPVSFQTKPPQNVLEDHNTENEAAPVAEAKVPLILRELRAHKGETVRAGTTLAVVSDLSELYIEGHAFEQDADLISESAQQGWKVTAVFDRAGQQSKTLNNLDLLYSASNVDVDSRTLRFYARLPNRVLREVPSPNGQTFVEWKYRLGQRLQLQVPVEEWRDQLVLPVEAIAREGAESYVFQENGDTFERIPVHVTYRDQKWAVVAVDGSIFPGEVIALRGAHQMLMALKNKSGGGVDPHAGHQH